MLAYCVGTIKDCTGNKYEIQFNLKGKGTNDISNKAEYILYTLYKTCEPQSWHIAYDKAETGVPFTTLCKRYGRYKRGGDFKIKKIIR